MSGFYKPFITKISERPLIVYPCFGIEKLFDRSKPHVVDEHLEKLYASNEKLLSVGMYHIVIIWDEASDDVNSKSHDVMTDVWIFDKVDSWGSGPLVDVKIFRNSTQELSIGVSAGDGLLMLGREEEQRRNAQSLENYINGPRASLPKDLDPTEDFYIERH